MIKRLFDVLASLLGLAILSPVMMAIALAVRLDSPGPVIFRQVRVGREGRPFQILKFRTMVPRTDGPGTAAPITVGGDPRITRVGSFLRQAKLDELPQLLNVLRGDMSLVGPRPEVPEYVAHYPEDARKEILSVRPGITDSASIEFRDESAQLAESPDPERLYVEVILPRKIELYKRYVRNRTFAGDLQVILQTIGRVVGG